jgi:alkaline phosphatase
VVRDAAGLAGIDAAQAAAGKTIGLFARQHVPFVIDREATVPTLPAMARTALSILGRAADGFVLQIEGGRVDHSAHSSDAYCLVREQVEFDETIAAVLEFVNGRDDTLLVITTDHGNANPGLTLYGKRGEQAFDQMCKASKSQEWIDGQLPSRMPVDDRLKLLPDLVEQAMGIKLNVDEMKIMSGVFRNQRVTPFAAANVWSFVLGSILADHFGVGFVSPNHTSDAVELLAMGPGSEAIPAWVDNTQMHAVMVAALGLGEARLLPGMEKVVVPTKPKTDD